MKEEEESKNIRFALLTLASYIERLQGGCIDQYNVIDEIHDILSRKTDSIIESKKH